jgi:hypothetical protein
MWPSRGRRPVSGTWANRPAAGSLGERYIATDLNNATFKWNGSAWVPEGPQRIVDLLGTIAAPVSAVLNSTNTAGGSTLFTKSAGGVLIPQFPAGLLSVGSRFRVRARGYRTGTGASITLYWKFGTLGTTSDSSISSISYTAANASFTQNWLEFLVASNTVLAHNGNVGAASGSSGSTTHGGEVAINLANSYFLSYGVSATLNAADTVQINDLTVELL